REREAARRAGRRQVEADQRLTGLVGGADAEVGREVRHRLRAGVLVAADGRGRQRERRRVVDGVDGEGEGLRGAGVLAAVGRAAVVGQRHTKRRRAVAVRRRLVRETLFPYATLFRSREREAARRAGRRQVEADQILTGLV